MTESRPPAGERIARAFSADRESPPLGGPTSFEEIYLTYAARLRTIAIRKFHVPPSEADTLVHDVFTTFFMHASSVHAVEPYLIGAICNASRHYRRTSDAAAALFCGATPCAAAQTGALSDEIERKLLLSRVLRGIGRRCRELLQAYYIQGDTTQAIADVLRSTRPTVHVFLHQCRKRALARYRDISEKR